MTLVFSPSVNLAVVDAPPAVETDWPMPTASDDENASMIIIVGLCPSSPCLDSSENITPELAIMNIEERSHLPGLASRARRMGLAKASPTITSWLTFSRSIVERISSTSSLRLSSSTVEPPPTKRMSCVKQPVPCMSGQAGRPTKPGPPTPPSTRS